MQRSPSILVVSLLAACTSSAAEPEPELPAAALQEIAERLVTDAGAPGAVLGVMRGEQRWLGAAGTQDLAGTVPMTADAVFYAGSITKMFTGTLVLQEVEAGRLSLDDTLDAWHPEFPNADAITIDALLSHTGGVTTQWFADPQVQALVLADLEHPWTPGEVIAVAAELEPFGAPGDSGMQYSNAGFVLLGDVLAQETGRSYEQLVRERIAGPLGLAHTGIATAHPPGLVPGYFELAGTPLDIAQVPGEALLGFVGAAGAAFATADELLTFADALAHEGALLGDDALATMMEPAEPGSWYARAAMRFCPCEDGAYTGWGHGGNLPGYWAILVDYPEHDATIVAMINRDVVDGVALEREVFDPTLAAVLEALP